MIDSRGGKEDCSKEHRAHYIAKVGINLSKRLSRRIEILQSIMIK